MFRSFKFRLYPSRQNKVVLQAWLSACRGIYNNALAEKKNAWENEKKKITYRMQQNALPVMKQQNKELAGVHSQVLQDALRRLDNTYKKFYSRVKSGQKLGYPRFKSSDRYDSFTFPQSGFWLKGKKLQLSKIGRINIKVHRQINSTIKTCTIKHEAGRWYAIFSADVQEEREMQTNNSAIGFDAGLTRLVTLSNGRAIAHPKFYKKAELRIAFEQRHLSRKKKGSKNKWKRKLRLRVLHMRISNKRQDFLHKFSRHLVNEYGIIVHEDLEIQKMQMESPPGLSKSIADASWGILMRMLDYKAEEAGSQVIKVDAGYTTQMCSGCGNVAQKLLSERMHNCTKCGLVLDRDHNAAINILKKGLEKLGQELPELTPARVEEDLQTMKQEAAA